MNCMICGGSHTAVLCPGTGLNGGGLRGVSPQAIEQWKQQAGANVGNLGSLQQQLAEQYNQFAKQDLQSITSVVSKPKEKSMHKWRVTFKANGGTESRGHEAQEAMVDRDGALTFWIDSRLVAAYADGVWQAMVLETPK